MRAKERVVVVMQHLRSAFEWRDYLVGLPGENAILVEGDNIPSPASCLNRGRSEDHDELLGQGDLMSGWSHTKGCIIILILFEDVGYTGA